MKVASFSSASPILDEHCQGGGPLRGTAVLGEHTRARVTLPERSEIFTTAAVTSLLFCSCNNRLWWKYWKVQGQHCAPYHCYFLTSLTSSTNRLRVSRTTLGSAIWAKAQMHIWASLKLCWPHSKLFHQSRNNEKLFKWKQRAKHHGKKREHRQRHCYDPQSISECPS